MVNRLLPFAVPALLAGCFVTEDDLDADGDGFAPVETGGLDCDDDDPAIHPDAPEVCGNEVDDNCDGRIDHLHDRDGRGLTERAAALSDDARLTDGAVFARDDDGDGFGIADDVLLDCPSEDRVLLGTGDDQRVYAPAAGDCDDADPAINPDAIDNRCDGVDDDCDGVPDQAVSPDTIWWPDRDEDGFGDDSNPDRSFQGCPPTDDPIDTWIDQGGDCDDDEPLAHPGREDVCDGIDNDCSGAADEGVLGDGAECPAATCEEIHLTRPETGTGEFWIRGLQGIQQVTCSVLESRGWLKLDLPWLYENGSVDFATFFDPEGTAEARWIALEEDDHGVLLRPYRWSGDRRPTSFAELDALAEANLARCHTTEARATFTLPYEVTRVTGSWTLQAWRPDRTDRHRGSDIYDDADFGVRADCNEGAVLFGTNTRLLKAPGLQDSIGETAQWGGRDPDDGSLLYPATWAISVIDGDLDSPTTVLRWAINDASMIRYTPGLAAPRLEYWPRGNVLTYETGGVITDVEIYVR